MDTNNNIRKIDFEIPEGGEIKINYDTIELKKEDKEKIVKYNPVYTKIETKDNKIFFVPLKKKKTFYSVTKTTSKLFENALKGFEKEFVYKLKIVYSHFPITVKVEGENILINNFLGEKKPRKTKINKGCKVEIKGKDVFVKGDDKYLVGQTAANIENKTKVRGKDYRIFDDGVYITEKNIKE